MNHNIQPAEKFDQPTAHDAYIRNPLGAYTPAGTCYVYAARSWRQESSRAILDPHNSKPEKIK